MSKPIKFVRLETSPKGLMTRAISAWNSHIDLPPEDYHWVFIDDPEKLAHTLEILSVDMPEEDLAALVTRLPYLILVFQKASHPYDVPVEAMIAMLSILNTSGLVTLLRQASNQSRLLEGFKLDPAEWVPLFFLVGGKPDLDSEVEDEAPKNFAFF